MFPCLSSPLKIKNIVFKNRYVEPPNMRAHGEATGFVNSRTIDNYYTEASGGVAAICVMGSYVRIDGRAFIGQLGIDTDETV
jgi:2,4-dienoyl-CoA reductase-like NADH-dependent reductase (Old Yellow Enzyme family)